MALVPHFAKYSAIYL